MLRFFRKWPERIVPLVAFVEGVLIVIEGVRCGKIFDGFLLGSLFFGTAALMEITRGIFAKRLTGKWNGEILGQLLSQ